MKLKTSLIIALILGVALFGAISRWNSMVDENRDLKQNNNWLVDENEKYKTEDSLNAISIQQLNLSLDEVKKAREQDYELIQQLKVDKKRLQSITTSQSETIYKLKASKKDSIIYRDSLRVDTVRCWEYHDKWLDFVGCEIEEMDVEINSRDSLLYIEHVVPHKFWFIKWGQKERKQDIVSKNPNTEILDAEFITIRD